MYRHEQEHIIYLFLNPLVFFHAGVLQSTKGEADEVQMDPKWRWRLTRQTASLCDFFLLLFSVELLAVQQVSTKRLSVWVASVDVNCCLSFCTTLSDTACTNFCSKRLKRRFLRLGGLRAYFFYSVILLLLHLSSSSSPLCYFFILLLFLLYLTSSPPWSYFFSSIFLLYLISSSPLTFLLLLLLYLLLILLHLTSFLHLASSMYFSSFTLLPLLHPTSSSSSPLFDFFSSILLLRHTSSSYFFSSIPLLPATWQGPVDI